MKDMKHIKSINEANSGELKLYYFNPNDYGEEFFVMSRSIEEAYESLIKFLTEDEYSDYLRKLWSKVDIHDKSTYPPKCTVDVIGENQVVRTERS
jgi:hypothetical protein